MHHRLLALTTAAVFLLGIGKALAAETLSGPQIALLISDKTTYGEHAFKDRKGFGYWRPDGTYVNARGAGTWELKGNMFCRTHSSDNKTSCREIRDNGDGTYAHILKNGKHVWTWTNIAEGNAENL